MCAKCCGRVLRRILDIKCAAICAACNEIKMSVTNMQIMLCGNQWTMSKPLGNCVIRAVIHPISFTRSA